MNIRILKNVHVVALLLLMIIGVNFASVNIAESAGTWNQQMSAGQREWTSITSSSDGTKLAAVSGGFTGGVYTSTDSGSTWTEQLDAGQREWTSITSSSDGTKLAAAANNGYVYTSTDSGSTWNQQMSAGQREWTSITSSSDGTKLAAVSGGFLGGVYTSTDSGSTWTEQLDAGQREWTSITSSSDGTKLAAVSGGDFQGKIYTSTDSGVNWTEQMSAGQKDWTAITSSSDGTKLAAVSGGVQGELHTSTDSGTTWTQQMSAGQREWTSITSSSDGTKLAAVSGGDFQGKIYTSTDSGVNWTEQMSAGQKDWTAITSSSDGTKLAAVSGGVEGYVYTYGIDDVEPTVETLTPLDNETQASILRNLVIVFDEDVNVVTGSISIYKASNDSLVEEIDVTSDRVTGDGTNTIRINPISNFEHETSYYVQIDATSFDDLSGNSFAGISDEVTWNFTTGDSSSGAWVEQTNSGQRSWNSITSSADGTKLAAVGSGTYIYTSNDSGVTWTEQTNSGQRYWTSITSSSDGTKLAASVQNGLVYTSNDSGVTWTEQTDSGSRNWTSITSSADGTKLALAAYNSYIYTSNDSGETWITQTDPGSAYWRSVASSVDGKRISALAQGEFIYTYLETSESETTTPTSGGSGGSSTEINASCFVSETSIETGEDVDIRMSVDATRNGKPLDYVFRWTKILSGSQEEVEYSFDEEGAYKIQGQVQTKYVTKNITCDTIKVSDTKRGSSGATKDAGKTTANSLDDVISKYKDFLITLYKLGIELPDNVVSILGVDIASPSSNQMFTVNLELGDLHKEVKLLQSFLNSKGYAVALSGPGSIGNETEMFGYATQSALIRFQQANNISPAVGYFGPVTRSVISSL